MGQSSEFNPDHFISYKFPEATYSYSERDVVLYALGVGACARDALDDKELKYAYHADGPQFIQVLPTFAAIVGLSSFDTDQLPMEFDQHLLLHGQQYIEIHKPYPSSGCIQNKACISGFHDKGFVAGVQTCRYSAELGKAAIVEIEVESYEKESGQLLSTNRTTIYLRGAGGFSKSSKPYSYSKYPNSPDSALKVPKTQPLAVFEDCTQPSQALLYRLSGDYNPLHSDPIFAENAGFSRPILHGLCSLGFAVRAIIRCICRGDPNMVKNIHARFLLHVYPGETLITEMWLQGLRVVYQTKVKERSKTVLSGYVDLTRLASSL